MAVVFDPAQFKIDYPQFSNLSNTSLTNTFNYNALPNSKWVYLYCDWDEGTQLYWMSMVLSHILTVTYGSNGNGISTSLSGRISQASTGDVSVSFDYAAPKDSSEAEWNKTVFGQQVYKMMMALPIAEYVC